MRRKLSERNIRKLTRLGGHSLGLTIPIEFVRKLKWRERQKVVVTMRGKKLTVQDWPVRPTRQARGKQAQGKPDSAKLRRGKKR